MNPHRRTHSGFTLIELLVVVAIIALLIAILLPSLARARMQAKTAACLSNMKQFGMGYTYYAQVYDDFLPWTANSDGYTNTASKCVGPWNDTAIWFNSVTAMLNTQNLSYYQMMTGKDITTGLQVSPGYENDDGTLTGSGTPVPKAGSNSIFVCPLVAVVNLNESVTSPAQGADGYLLQYGLQPGTSGNFVPHRTFWSYVTNSKIDNTPNITGTAASPYQKAWMKRQSIVNWTVVPFLVERAMGKEEIIDPYSVAQGFNTSLNRSKTTWTRMATRHNGGGNLVMVDGHAERFDRSLFLNKVGGATSGPNYVGSIPGSVVWDPSDGSTSGF